MKKFLITLCAICISVFAFAQTETLNWYIGDDVYATTTCESGNDILLPTTPTKRGYTFKGWVSYIPIEYLESTGTQYIDTGVIYSSANHKSVVRFSHVDPGVDPAPWWVWGSDHGLSIEGDRSGSVALKSNNSILGIGIGNTPGGGSPYTIPNPTDPITVDIETKDNNTFSVSVNGVPTYTNVSFTGSCIGTFSETLFGIMTNTGVIRTTSTKIYAAKLYDNDILVRDFIPVLDGKGTPCMYDKVEEKFYYNAGTGQFIAGPVIGE